MLQGNRSRYALVGSITVAVVLAGCGGTAPPPVATAAATAPSAAPPPPPPVPPPSAPAPPVSADPSVVQVPDFGGIPSWAGQSQGEPFDVKAYLTSREAPAENAAPLYLTALEQLAATMATDEVKAFQKDFTGPAGFEKLLAGSLPAENVKRMIDLAAPAVEQIDAAQAKPQCVFDTELGLETLLPHVQAARDFARVSVLHLYQAREQGDFELAEAALRRCLRLSRDLQPRGGMVCQLVSMAIDDAVFVPLRRMTINDPRLTAEACDRLLAVVLEHQDKLLNRVEEGLKSDYIMTRNTLRDMQSGRLTLEKVKQLSGEKTPANVQLPAINPDAEIAACNRLYVLLLEAAKDRSPQEDKLQAAIAEHKRLVANWQAHGPIAAQTGKSNVPLAVITLVQPGVIQNVDRRAKAGIGGVLALLAVRRYELTHGSLPQSLDIAAAETALGTVPNDPFSGAPLKFALVAGNPTIYSIGPDRKDDAGKVEAKATTTAGDILFVLTPQREPPKPQTSLVATTVPTSTPKAATRTWTSTIGTKIEAELVKVDAKQATLKKSDGTEVKVPLDKLILKDRQWINANAK